MKLAVFKDAVLVSIECKMPGSTRQCEDDQYQVAADKTLLKLRKTLLDCDEWKAIRSTFSEIRWWLKGRKVPGTFFRPGCFLLKKTLLPELEIMFSSAQQNLASRVDALVNVYEMRKQEAISRLDKLGNDADYPSVAQLRRAISVKMTTVELDIPDNIDPAVAEQQMAQANAEWQQAVEEIRLALRQSMLELVDHLSNRLETGEDKKTVSARSFEQLEKFLIYFSHRDVTNDAEMAEMVKQATEILANVDIDQLRVDDSFRSKLKGQFDGIKTTLDGMVKDQTTRLIELED
jgi:hypothetical protein